jgi:hypothetical protein
LHRYCAACCIYSWRERALSFSEGASRTGPYGRKRVDEFFFSELVTPFKVGKKLVWEEILKFTKNSSAPVIAKSNDAAVKLKKE